MRRLRLRASGSRLEDETLQRDRLVVAALAVAGLLPAMIASCAAADDGNAPEPSDTVAVPGSDAGDASIDGDLDECAGDAGGERCTTQARSCEESDFCSVDAPVTGHTVLAVWGSAKNDVWAAGTAGKILHFDGTSWTEVPSPTKQTFFTIWGSSASDVWIASSRSAIFRGGPYEPGMSAAAWSPVAEIAPPRPSWSPKEAMMLTLWGSGPDDVWIAGEPYPIDDGLGYASQWRSRVPTEDDASSWTPTGIGGGTEPTTPPIRGLWGSSKSDVWAVGGGDGLYYSSVSTRGKTYHATELDEAGSPIWTEVDSQSVPLLFSVWGSSAGDVWAVGNEGTIRHWVTGAKRWDVVASPTSEDLRSIWGSGPNDIWAVGAYGTILHYDGTSWQPATIALPLGSKPDLSAVWGSGPDDVWAVGKGIILHFTGKKPGAMGNR